MKTTLKRLLAYGIGVRSLSESDFYKICKQLNITVIHSKEKFAFSFTMMGQQFIVLPLRKKGLQWLFTALHELAHILAGHVQHKPRVAFYGLETQYHDKNESEADAIALVALIPKEQIQELAAEFGQTRFGNKLWQERCRLFFLYGI